RCAGRRGGRPSAGRASSPSPGAAPGGRGKVQAFPLGHRPPSLFFARAVGEIRFFRSAQMAGPRPRPMKQRTAPKGALRRLSARERAAHDSTGFVWGSGGVPRDATLRTLHAYGIRGDAAEGVLAAAVRPLGHFRMEEAARSARLSRLELVQQAHDTAAMAE